MRFRFSSVTYCLLALVACGTESGPSNGGPKENEAGAGGEGDAGAGALGGEGGASVEGGTGGTNGGSSGSGKGGNAGSAGSTGTTGGTAGADGGTAGADGGTAGADGGTAGASGGGTNAGTAGSAGAPSCTLADSWQTIDDFQLAAGQHSNPASIASAPPNRLYAVGIARMGTFQWTVRRSNDGGGTWDPVDDEGVQGGASDVVVDSAGTVFVVGGAAAGRIVRRSTDNGDNWTTVDTIPVASPTDPCSSGWLAKTANDTIYVAAGCDSTGVVVRRSTNGGDSWSPVESFRYTTTTPTRMGTLGVDATGQAYVGGTAVQAMDGSNHWLVRRGTGSGTWTTVDDYQLAPANYANVASFFGSADAIYAAGSANDAAGASHWIIRRASNNDPSGFTTVDDVGPSANLETLAAHSVYQASSGMFVAAGLSRGNAPARVVYRRSSNGQTWSPAGDFQYVNGADSAPVGRITEDAAGNLFGMVRGVGTDGFAHWIVRKLPCN
jgi:hypothetical protein